MTQIIERVARGIFTFVYLWGEEQTDEGRAEAHAAWENLQEKPSLSSTDNKQKYRNYAQAALKEIKLDELVESALIAMNWKPMENIPDAYIQNNQRVLLWVPAYGPTTGHYDNGWHLHSVLNKEAKPTMYCTITAPRVSAELEKTE